MGLFRLVAVILFAVAAGCAFGWWFHASLTTDVGLIAAGLFFGTVSGLGPEPTIPMQ